MVQDRPVNSAILGNIWLSPHLWMLQSCRRVVRPWTDVVLCRALRPRLRLLGTSVVVGIWHDLNWILIVWPCQKHCDSFDHMFPNVTINFCCRHDEKACADPTSCRSTGHNMDHHKSCWRLWKVSGLPEFIRNLHIHSFGLKRFIFPVFGSFECFVYAGPISIFVVTLCFADVSASFSL